ncbi:uncharacterized protein [Eleutherodactylus coqui]|uniref:uncharacterized protein n=1 Tax=Eleutherodactylus coqui TaxID=57060 RepID=UPI003461F349
MESAAALLLLLGVFCGCCGLELIDECPGNNVTFTAAASARPLQIHWFKDNSEIVEVKEGRKPFYYILQDRVIIDLPQRTLILKNVTPADSGSYRAAVLVGGTLENTNFRLLVDDLCNVIIYDVTVENKVKLQCICSSPGAAPSECNWYKWDSGNYYLVSDECRITVRKEEKTQLYKCVACNKVSNKYATFTVPIKVPDPVCNVTIRNTTVENNVTLQCVCSSSGAAPAKYEWYKWDSGNYRNVSDGCSITVHKEEKTQLYKCVASYKVSNNSATFTVPNKIPEPPRRLNPGIYVLIATLVLAFIIIVAIVAILLLRKINKNVCKASKDKLSWVTV